MSAAVRSTCPYCGVGCGVQMRRTGEAVEVGGDIDHPANFGRLCSKGSALGETLGLAGRLLHPDIRGRRATWDEALSEVAQALNGIIRTHGPDAVALYVSGQLLTEDYYVANKLMKGYIGSANIDTNSRLCMASAVAGHKRAFGEDLVPVCYDDLECADLIVLVGSNTAWCHPVLYQRIVQARRQRPGLKVVVIDPRRTPTCDIADLHLPIRPGTDVWLFNGLLAHLHHAAAVHAAFIANHTAGAAEALQVALDTAGSLEAVARTCGVETDLLSGLYSLFARTERVVTAFSQGVNQSSAGTDKVNSIINCHLYTGRIGRPGMGPFSITGQPNAMGGREVGGLANTLAAHLDIENAAHRQIVQSFWGSPRIASRPGLKAVDLFEAIHAGRIKAVWIMATNPIVSLPDANRVREALRRCELVIVSDCVARTDTTDLAHVLLPAAAWGEKDGTVTNSERRISRQRTFLPLPGEARPDWWIVSQVAQRMGFVEGFSYDDPRSIFAEHARLSCEANDGSRAFNIGGLAELTASEYDSLEPVQWPVPRRAHHGTARLFADGRFYHPDGRARFVPTPPRGPVHPLDGEWPLVLNTGRVRDQWHTMTRTGRSPRLAEHSPEPYADVHAQDALLAGVREGELVRLTTRWGSMVVRLRTSGEISRGNVFVPIHWNDCNASDARAGALVNPIVDPLSGEPEFKHTPVRLEPFPVDWYAFVFARQPLQCLDATWWTLITGSGWLRYELAGRKGPSDWAAWTRQLLGASDVRADFLDYYDAGGGVYRAAHVVDDRLDACICVAPRPMLPSRQWIAALFARERLDDADRLALLAGRALDPRAETGPLVCSCFGVGRNTIVSEIRTHHLRSAAQVGQRLKAGTNCGSCLPEIAALVTQIEERSSA